MSLRALLAGGAMGWAALLPIATLAVAHPQFVPGSSVCALLVYGLGSAICHQLPARSFHVWATQLPVCARCTGLYLGAALAALAHVALPRSLNIRGSGVHSTWRARMLLFAAALPTAATLVFEWTTGRVPSNAIRASSGLPLGAVVLWILLDVTDSTQQVR